jgi:hypothetical protein
MAWKLAEAAWMSLSFEQHCDPLRTAQDQLKTALALHVNLGVKTTPQTGALRAEMCLLSFLYAK